MADYNSIDSMKDVVETVAPVLQTIINDVIRFEMPSCNYVYDPDLSYETSLQRFRNNNTMNNTTMEALPLFSFRRTALRYPDDGSAPNMRSTSHRGVQRLPDGGAVEYSAVHCEFDLDFLYINKFMQELEQFEITYMSEDGISSVKEITVTIPQLGDFKYFLAWSPLLDISDNTEDNFYKGLAGTLKVRGFFFVFRTESKQILEINANIRAFYESIAANDLIRTINIVP